VTNPEKPRRLGRGLEALISSAAPASPADGSQVQRVPVDQIRPNPYQPRKEFRPEDLAELESSLRANGLLQPISLRKASSGYELIAGERRLRAATRLGWREIPAIVKDVDDRTLLTLALVENLQRADLNPVEEAEGYQRLIKDFEFTQQQVADAVGKDRTTITNLLRLLTLPAAVRGLVASGLITAGHARALLPLDSERQVVELANETVANQLTVREVERRVRAIVQGDASGSPATAAVPTPTPGRSPTPPQATTSPQLKLLEDRLRRHLQTDVAISAAGAERGTIRIGFYSADDLERVLDLILGSTRSDFD
jgi:ParB family transcriptional regulator, chromosome partitioning protein